MLRQTIDILYMTMQQNKIVPDLSQSKAHVSIYDERGLVRTFTVPYDEIGIVWDVLK